MNERYKRIMERQVLTNSAKNEFRLKLKNSKYKSGLRPRIKIIIATAILTVLITSSVLAVGFIRGKSTVNHYKDPVKAGFSIDYSDVKNYPLTAFAEDVRSIDGRVNEQYVSLTEAESALGISLCENSIVYGSDIKASRLYNCEDLGLGDRVHCYSTYEGTDGNLYRAQLNANYRLSGFDVIVSAVITAENDSVDISAETLHSSGRFYESDDIKSITDESYTAENGIEATVVTVKWNDRQADTLVANFVISGISYSVEIRNYPPNREDNAKELLCDIINAYSFCADNCSDTSHHHYAVHGNCNEHSTNNQSSENHHSESHHKSKDH